MSKKQRNNAKPFENSIPKAEVPKPTHSVLKEDVFEEKPFQLINFDLKLKVFLGICIGLFFVLSFMGISGSSNRIWNEIIPEGAASSEGQYGTAHRIRMDEYCVLTPFTISQANKGFPVTNQAVGGEKAPLMSFLPVKHFITAFRPSMWGYFFLNMDQGFAWSWNFKTFGILIGICLMLLLLTQNNFWLSTLGAFWALYSSGTQWWYSTNWSDQILCIGFLFTCAVYMVFGQKKWHILLASIGFVVFGLYFGALFYPPYQVPLSYFTLAFFIGFTLKHWSKQIVLNELYLKIGAIFFAFVTVATIMLLFYNDAKTTIDVMVNTVYPGKRVSLGGEGFTSHMFSEYFKWFTSEYNLPAKWINICELSHYLNFLPIILLSFGIYTFQTKKINWLVAVPLLFSLILTIFILFGFPEFLAKISLLSMSPAKRALIPFGLGNVLLTVLFINEIKKNTQKPQNLLLTILGIVTIIGFMIFTASGVNSTAENFFKSKDLAVGVILFAIANICLLNTFKFKYRELVFGAIILVYLWPNFMINPLAKGLKGITEHNIYKQVKAVEEKDPGHYWMIMRSQYYAYLASATGAKVLGGAKFMPNLKEMKYLDPKGTRDSVYNRYAHTLYSTYIDGKDSVVMKNDYEDAYLIALDVCSGKLKKMGVKYVLYSEAPAPPELRCLTKIGDPNLFMYKIND